MNEQEKKVNGTHAKDIALHYITLTQGRATPHIMGKTINQAKAILRSGYTKQEIINALDYAINVKQIQIYSLGYINASINTLLQELELHQLKEKVKEQQSSRSTSFQSEVTSDERNNESKERNREKTRRFGVQSGFGKKFNFDMFEKRR